jgi:transposase
LLFVPKYAPRLNPAETPMKEIKRYLSPLFLENTEKIKEKIIEGFEGFKKNN